MCMKNTPARPRRGLLQQVHGRLGETLIHRHISAGFAPPARGFMLCRNDTLGHLPHARLMRAG